MDDEFNILNNFAEKCNYMKIDIEERVTRAREFFTSGYNCAQAVALAYEDVIELDAETIAKLAASFGGGLSRLREVCGAVSGMAFVAGSLIPANNPLDTVAKRDKRLESTLMKAGFEVSTTPVPASSKGKQLRMHTVVLARRGRFVPFAERNSK